MEQTLVEIDFLERGRRVTFLLKIVYLAQSLIYRQGFNTVFTTKFNGTDFNKNLQRATPSSTAITIHILIKCIFMLHNILDYRQVCQEN